MTSRVDPREHKRLQFVKLLRLAIGICWAAMAAGFVSVAAAGHTSPPALMAFAGALLCLAAVFLVLFRALGGVGRNHGHQISGRGMALIFALCGVGAALIVLMVFL